MDGKHPRQLRPAAHSAHRANPDDDYKAASKGVDEAVDYKQYMPKLKPDHKLIKRIVKLVVLIVVVAGLGYAAYYFGSHYHSGSNSPVKKTTSSSSSSKIATPSQTYTSSYQDLSFEYPSGWKVNETSSVITATSPATRLTSYNRQSVTGRVIFRVRAQSSSLPEFSAGDATAILPSQTITYTSPATGQRGSTYISFLNYANSKGNGIDGVYITGDTGYQAGQNSPESDIQAVDPVISFTFVKCSNKACSSTDPLTISTSSWSSKAFSASLLTMLESLSIS
jgi:hypothetical protein